MGRATLAELVSLLLQLTLSPIVATGQDAGATVSYSALDFKTCASGAEFKLTDKSGVGQIVDKETGRCLTVKKCSAPWPSTACTNACVHGNGDVVVLEDCDLEDTWRVTALTNLPGYLARHTRQPVTRCITLTIYDAAQQRKYRSVESGADTRSSKLFLLHKPSR